MGIGPRLLLLVIIEWRTLSAGDQAIGTWGPLVARGIRKEIQSPLTGPETQPSPGVRPSPNAGQCRQGFCLATACGWPPPEANGHFLQGRDGDPPNGGTEFPQPVIGRSINGPP